MQVLQGGVIVGVHQGAVLGQLQCPALFQHLADELRAEIVPTPPPADVQPAQDQPQHIEAVQVAVGHHVVGPAAGAGVGLLAHLQRIEGAGHVRAQPERTPVQVLPAGACGEHGVAVLAGGAVQTAEVLVKGEGRMGVACPGKPIDQIGQQRARAGEQDVDGFHGRFLLTGVGVPVPV